MYFWWYIESPDDVDDVKKYIHNKECITCAMPAPTKLCLDFETNISHPKLEAI